ATIYAVAAISVVARFAVVSVGVRWLTTSLPAGFVALCSVRFPLVLPRRLLTAHGGRARFFSNARQLFDLFGPRKKLFLAAAHVAPEVAASGDGLLPIEELGIDPRQEPLAGEPSDCPTKLFGLSLRRFFPGGVLRALSRLGLGPDDRRSDLRLPLEWDVLPEDVKEDLVHRERQTLFAPPVKEPLVEPEGVRDLGEVRDVGLVLADLPRDLVEGLAEA